jgi:hypothetical protein
MSLTVSQLREFLEVLEKEGKGNWKVRAHDGGPNSIVVGEVSEAPVYKSVGTNKRGEKIYGHELDENLCYIELSEVR